jgi:hypothetical protein
MPVRPLVRTRSARTPVLARPVGSPAPQRRRRPDRGGDIRRTGFAEQTNGTERAESWRVRCRHPDRTAGTTGLRQPSTTRNPGGPAMITSPATAASPATSSCGPRAPARHHLDRQRPPRPQRAAGPCRPDRLAGPGHGRCRAPRQEPGRHLLRTLRTARIRHRLRRERGRARTARRRARVRAQAPRRPAQRAAVHGDRRGRSGRHPVLSLDDGRAAGRAARPQRRGQANGRTQQCPAGDHSGDAQAGSGSSAGARRQRPRLTARRARPSRPLPDAGSRARARCDEVYAGCHEHP